MTNNKRDIDWDGVKGFFGALAFAVVILGFAWLVVLNYERGKAACPGYYNVNYGCAVSR